jgi:hypothetical protein
MNNGRVISTVLWGCGVCVATLSIYYWLGPKPSGARVVERSTLALNRTAGDTPPFEVSAGRGTEAPATLDDLPDRLPARPEPRYQQRPPGEWDGMLVNLAVTPPCEVGSPCGLARACIKGVCTACVTDGDCLRGESCVLDHCVLSDRVGCRSSKDCENSVHCVLSGYSPDPRSNGTMRSHCVEPNRAGGKTATRLPQPTPSSTGGGRGGPGLSMPTQFDDELNRAREAAEAK